GTARLRGPKQTRRGRAPTAPQSQGWRGLRARHGGEQELRRSLRLAVEKAAQELARLRVVEAALAVYGHPLGAPVGKGERRYFACQRDARERKARAELDRRRSLRNRRGTLRE